MALDRTDRPSPYPPARIFPNHPQPPVPTTIDPYVTLYAIGAVTPIVPDEPGVEMQHDTTVYWVKLGDQSVRLVASLIYLRYSCSLHLRFSHD